MKYTFEDLDERIIKTRTALTTAIFEIIKMNPKVKVLEICKKAGITPMTYYHHFHNKNQLLEFAVKNQLQNILPIPQKLKPANIRQLIAYLLKSFINFFDVHRNVINTSTSNLLNGHKSAYIYVLLKYMCLFIKREIEILVSNSNKIFASAWTYLITYGLFFMMFQTNSLAKHNQFSFFWNSFKELRINL